jgi:hypothetical protein
MLRKATIALTALAVVAATALLATPAQAETVTGGCWANPTSRLDADAQFVQDGSGWRTWYQFRGVLRGNVGDESNINFYFYQDYQQHWTSFSPDSIGELEVYSAHPNLQMPPWSQQQVRWEGIVDLPILGDPRCNAWSPIVSG